MALNELHLQSKCVDAVREMGGFAQKCSNRFLIGVPDLLVQLPGYTTSFWEVKWTPVIALKPDPTVKQKVWLRDFTKAGGFCGVIYFTMGPSDLMFVMSPAGRFLPKFPNTLSVIDEPDPIKTKWKIESHEYKPLPRGCKFQPFKDEIERIHNERSFWERKQEYGY